MSGFHLIYCSVASRELSTAELFGLLQKARIFNHTHGITGILLHAPGQYMQVLEGERPAIEALYGSICRDERHHQVLTLTQGATPRRVFPAWSMGLLAATPEEFARLVRHVNPARTLNSALRQHAMGPGLLALLEEFAMARIVHF